MHSILDGALTDRDKDGLIESFGWTLIDWAAPHLVASTAISSSNGTECWYV